MAAPAENRDFVGYGRFTPRVIWPESARVAVSILVNYEEGGEYSFARDGRNEGMGEFPGGLEGVADRPVESAFEYGSRAGFWRLVRLLDEYGIPATVNAVAEAVERNPEVGSYLRGSQHEVSCHGWRFEELWHLDREEEARHLAMAVRSLEQSTGRRPVGWISRLMPSGNTRELLLQEGGFLYDSDALNDDLPYFVPVGDRTHLVVPLSFTYNDGRFLIGGCDDPDAFARYCTGAFDELWAEGETHPKMMTIALHPRIIGQAGRITALRTFLEHARSRGGAWFARRRDVAEWWLAHHEEFQR